MSDLKREYEAIFIVKTELVQEGLEKFQTQVGEIVLRHAGKVLQFHNAGRRKLSFGIGRFREGIVLEARLSLSPGQVTPVQQALKLLEPLVRAMLVRTDDRKRSYAVQPSVQEGQDGKSQ